MVNSKSGADYGDEVIGIYPAFAEIVPFADQCALVFGIRTGLTEVVAAETKTRIAIVNHFHVRIESEYLFIPDKKINYWTIPSVRSTGFSYIDKNIFCVSENMKLDAIYCFKNLIDVFSNFVHADLRAYRWSSLNHSFDQGHNLYKDNQFCTIKYSILQESSFCLCKYAIQPALDYEIHACLKDATTGDIIAEQHFIRCNPLVFAVPRSGSFRIYMKIYHPGNWRYCCFESEPFNLTLSPLAALTRINEFQAYMRQLDSIKKECVILVVSRDAHTWPNSGRELYLAPLGARLEPEKRFRQSWLLVVDAGKAAVELADEAREVRTEYAWGANRARLASAGYNVHMNARAPVSIEINGVEAAVNGRGLNIVVWDRGRDVLLDSVVFDTYQPEAPMTRIKREFMVL